MSSIILGFLVIDESPRFLLAQRRIEETKQILKKMTDVNRRPPFLFNLLEELQEKNTTYISHDNGTMAEKRKSMAAPKEKLRRFYKIYILWGVYFFTYYGMNFSIFNVSDILWLNVSLFGLVEMIGLGTAGIVAKKYERVYTMRYSLFFSSFFCLITYYLNTLPLLKITSILCKLTSRQAFPDLFLQPTYSAFP